MRVVGRFLPAVVLLAAALFAPAAAGSVTVTVLDGNSPVPGARVCVGVPGNRSSIGSATTNASGVAHFSQSPSGTIQVTAGLTGRGAEAIVTPSGATTAVTLRLAEGGPTCTGTPSLQPLPTGGAVPGGGGSVVVPSPFVLKETPVPKSLPGVSPVLTTKREFCFGALGAACGGAQIGLPVAALCSFGSCSINGGSWRHDECCFRHPGGMACRLGPVDQFTGHDGNCVDEWNRAVSRLGYRWQRNVDFNKPNTVGTVVFADYCARAGSEVHVADVPFCCSRRAHVKQVASQFADPNLRVCD